MKRVAGIAVVLLVVVSGFGKNELVPGNGN
jgi:hypothetical protein